MFLSRIKTAFRNPGIRRDLIRQVLLRLAVCAAAALLWDRFFGSEGRGADLILLIGALILLAWAWGAWLRLDGLLDHHLSSKKPQAQSKRRAGGDMIDYISEDPDPVSELTSEERITVRFLASLISGLLLFIPVILLSF